MCICVKEYMNMLLTVSSWGPMCQCILIKYNSIVLSFIWFIFTYLNTYNVLNLHIFVSVNVVHYWIREWNNGVLSVYFWWTFTHLGIKIKPLLSISLLNFKWSSLSPFVFKIEHEWNTRCTNWYYSHKI